MLEEKLVKRKVSLKALDYGKVEEASQGRARQTVSLQVGINDEKAREIGKFIKGLGLKGVQHQVQGDQLRVTGKKRDDLQTGDRRSCSEHDFGVPAAVHQLPRLTPRYTETAVRSSPNTTSPSKWSRAMAIHSSAEPTAGVGTWCVSTSVRTPRRAAVCAACATVE